MSKNEETPANKDIARSSYLSFMLNGEHFAIEVGYVIEILEVPKITMVPKADPHMKGVINLRGKVLPVIDTCKKLGLPAVNIKKETCIIVLELTIDNDQVLCGILVDEVIEVFESDSTELQVSPSLEKDIRSSAMKGVIEINGEFIMVLEPEKTFGINGVFPDDLEQGDDKKAA